MQDYQYVDYHIEIVSHNRDYRNIDRIGFFLGLWEKSFELLFFSFFFFLIEIFKIYCIIIIIVIIIIIIVIIIIIIVIIIIITLLFCLLFVWLFVCVFACIYFIEESRVCSFPGTSRVSVLRTFNNIINIFIEETFS